jgi:hypothetical protein
MIWSKNFTDLKRDGTAAAAAAAAAAAEAVAAEFAGEDGDGSMMR